MQTALLPLAARSCVAPKGGRSLAFGFKGACELSKSKSNPSELGLPFRHHRRAKRMSVSTVADELKDSAPSHVIASAPRRQDGPAKKWRAVHVAFSPRLPKMKEHPNGAW